MNAIAGRLREHLSEPAHWIDLLLVFVPLAIGLELAHADESLIFVVAALGIVPLAGVLGKATDALAIRAGHQVGALLNATFGNAAELIITIAAIRAGLLDVVKASITGSILGNILLVLGFAVLAGGLKNGFQRFDLRRASTNVTMMAIAVIGLAVPAIFFQSTPRTQAGSVEWMSIGVAIALMLAYVLALVFTFRLPRGEKRAPVPLPEPEEEEEETRGWTPGAALGVLFGAVVLVAILSEILVAAVEPLIQEQGLTELFVGIIIVPIIGNAAEHLVAVEMAWRNKMELALGIALGSSLQVALFVAPLLVFISLAFGTPMTLIFNSFELVALGAAVVVAALIAIDGESNWLEGAQLLIVYVILALAFFFLPA